MRKEYLDLQEAGGLTVNHSLLNQVNLVQGIQDLKAYQIDLLSNLQNELSDNIVQTLKFLSLTDENENVNTYEMSNSPANSFSPSIKNNFTGINPSLYEYINLLTQSSKDPLI